MCVKILRSISRCGGHLFITRPKNVHARVDVAREGKRPKRHRQMLCEREAGQQSHQLVESRKAYVRSSHLNTCRSCLVVQHGCWIIVARARSMQAVEESTRESNVVTHKVIAFHSKMPSPTISAQPSWYLGIASSGHIICDPTPHLKDNPTQPNRKPRHPYTSKPNMFISHGQVIKFVPAPEKEAWLSPQPCRHPARSACPSPRRPSVSRPSRRAA